MKIKKKKYPFISQTVTTGDIAYNIDMFNKHAGTSNDNNNPTPFAGDKNVNLDNTVGHCDILAEEKRYVRRYYIRPQNIFCSNKAEILKALIDLSDQDCTIYTLINLGDDKDVTKLTTKDIIYYYDDGILYDKNRMKLMDYDLYIKQEEERPNINLDTASDATIEKVYADRITDKTDLEEAIDQKALIEAEQNPFMQDFISVNAYGDKLIEGKQVDGTCCICGEPIEGYGNNADPVAEGRCCDACNIKFVLPARSAAAFEQE